MQLMNLSFAGSARPNGLCWFRSDDDGGGGGPPQGPAEQGRNDESRATAAAIGTDAAEGL